jgi:2'-5' RNA ligase
MESIRAFIAIELPAEVKASLARVQDELRRREPAAIKWVAPDSVHLTLKFLGNVDAAKIEPIAAAMSRAVEGIGAFEVSLGTPGAFPNLRAPRVICIRLGGDTDSLSALQRGIERSVAPLGFPPEKRPFSPHLTLGRVRDTASANDRRFLGETVSSLDVETSLSFNVETVSLMRSTLTPARAIYDRIASTPLVGR